VHTDEACPYEAGNLWALVDGRIVAQIDPDCPQGLLELAGRWNFSDFAMQTQMNLQNTEGAMSLEYFFPSELVFLIID